MFVRDALQIVSKELDSIYEPRFLQYVKMMNVFDYNFLSD